MFFAREHNSLLYQLFLCGTVISTNVSNEY